MRVMVIVKATKASETGVMPDERLLAEMGNYNEELVKAGILLAGEGLHPSPARSAPSSMGRSPRPKSSSPVSGCGRLSRWTRPSSG